MPRIRVVKPFVLSLTATKLVPFAAGVHDVSDEIAKHPYVVSLADGHIADPAELIATEQQAAAEKAAAEQAAAEAAAAEQAAAEKASGKKSK